MKTDKHHHEKLPTDKSKVWFRTTSMDKHDGIFIQSENMFLVQSTDDTNEDFYFPANIISWGYIIEK